MITSEGLREVNDAIQGIKIERKDKKTGKMISKQYALVTERIQAFRKLCPDGCIETEIVSMEGGVVTMKAVIKDETGKVIGTGLAQEKESNGYINATSYIENCETSAVGRALGFAGIGVDDSMASAEEVANAMKQQEDEKKKLEALSAPLTDKEKEILKRMVERKGLNVEEVFPEGMDVLTAAHYSKAMEKFKGMPDKE